MGKTKKLALVVSSGVLATAIIVAPANANAAVATQCVDVIDIGITKKDGNYAKGSGSYTSCGTIRKVTLRIYSGDDEQNSQTRTMSSGSASFSVVENCGSYQPSSTWHTTITAYTSSGSTWGHKTSNYDKFNC